MATSNLNKVLHLDHSMEQNEFLSAKTKTRRLEPTQHLQGCSGHTRQILFDLTGFVEESTARRYSWSQNYVCSGSYTRRSSGLASTKHKPWAHTKSRLFVDYLATLNLDRSVLRKLQTAWQLLSYNEIVREFIWISSDFSQIRSAYRTSSLSMWIKHDQLWLNRLSFKAYTSTIFIPDDQQPTWGATIFCNRTASFQDVHQCRYMWLQVLFTYWSQ